MHAYKVHHYAAARLLWLALAGFLMQPVEVVGAPDERFDVLEVGTHTYTNVTVTTKAKNCIFILHAAGMTSIKVSQLPPDVQEKLGYVVARPPKPATNTAGMWVKREISNLNVPQVKDLTKQLEQKWRRESAARSSAMGLAGPKLIVAVLGVVLLLYLLHCYCCMLICRKTGNPSGILVWLPCRAGGFWLTSCRCLTSYP
jgi:hypothetical protein